MKNIKFKDSFDFIYGNLWLPDSSKIKQINPQLRVDDSLYAQQKVQQISPVVQQETIVPQQKPATQAKKTTGEITNWHTLESLLNNCNLCPLSEGRNNVVIERGSRTAQWMFIGDETDAAEDIEAQPFVGQAGALLDKMIVAMQNKCNEQVDFYITNAVKCKTPANRHPQTEEIETCQNYLHQQIKFIQPKIIIILGRFAAQAVLNTKLGIHILRETKLEYKSIPVIATYSPEYLLRNPHEKNKAWEDLQKAVTIYQQIVTH
jgi:uracil-DNA glycosylase family 4